MSLKIGDLVKYWTGDRPIGRPSGQGHIRIEAKRGQRVVYWISGLSHCVEASHVVLVKPEAPAAPPPLPPAAIARVTRQARYEVRARLNGAAKRIAQEQTMAAARGVLRKRRHLDAWIVDRDSGLRYDLRGVISLV